MYILRSIKANLEKESLHFGTFSALFLFHKWMDDVLRLYPMIRHALSLFYHPDKYVGNGVLRFLCQVAQLDEHGGQKLVLLLAVTCVNGGFQTLCKSPNLILHTRIESSYALLGVG